VASAARPHYYRRRRANHQKSAAVAPTNCWWRRRDRHRALTNGAVINVFNRCLKDPRELRLLRYPVGQVYSKMLFLCKKIEKRLGLIQTYSFCSVWKIYIIIEVWVTRRPAELILNNSGHYNKWNVGQSRSMKTKHDDSLTWFSVKKTSFAKSQSHHLSTFQDSLNELHCSMKILYEVILMNTVYK